MGLTSRELATVIIFAGIIVLSVALAKDRRAILRSLFGVIKAFVAWKIWSIVLAYLIYVVVMVVVAHWLGAWSQELLKDTIIVGFFTGLPILFNATRFNDGTDVVVHVVKEVGGVAALLAVYLNLGLLPLWGELVVQTLLIFLVLLALVGKQGPKTVSIAMFLDGLVGVIALGLIIYVTVQIFTNFSGYDWEREASTFALSVWLPLSLIPFIYLIGVIAALDGALVRLRFHNNKEKPPIRVRLALLLGVRSSLRYATGLSGHWLPRVATETSFSSARRTMREYRRAIRGNARQNRERRRRLRQQAGMPGVDEQGLWRDRREFHESKEALERIFYAQMGLYRNRGGHYWTDPIVVFPVGGFRELPDDHGVQFRVRDDGQAWAGWRRTVGGYYLGIGGTDDFDAYWRYAGAEPPAGYPEWNAEGWIDVFPAGEGSPEWAVDDAPPPRA